MNHVGGQILFGPYGAAGLEWGTVLREYGANAVWFHSFDPAAMDACSRFGLAACVEFPTFRADYNKRPDLIPIGSDGKPIRYGSLVQGICLSNREFLEEIELNLLNGVKQFSPHGIWLDYLTYAGWFESADPDLQESCFCPACVADFCEATGLDVQSPQVILDNHAEQWKRHKCLKIAEYAAKYAEIIRTYHPNCIIGAYMCPWTPEEYEGALSRIFAQDYHLLANSIDIFTPLIYAAKSGRTNAWGREFLENCSSFVQADKKVQLILDYKDFPGSLEATASSTIPSWGLQMFAGSGIFADPEQAVIFRQSVETIKEKSGY